MHAINKFMCIQFVFDSKNRNNFINLINEFLFARMSVIKPNNNTVRRAW